MIHRCRSDGNRRSERDRWALRVVMALQSNGECTVTILSEAEYR